MTEAEKKVMINRLIGVGILIAVIKFVPNQYVKGAALGVIGTSVAGYIPFVNGQAIGGV